MRSILQVNSSDIAGGAERISWNLHCAYRKLGYQSRLAVGSRRSKDPDVYVIDALDSSYLWTRSSLAIETYLSPFVGKIRGAGTLQRAVRLFAAPKRAWQVLQGHEDFYSPGTWRILDICGPPPDILHCHNLHRDYFDLEALPWLSGQVPVILTLHDAWLLSGHCAHSFDCEKWKEGCGSCPDLRIPPSILRDATAFNWRRKRSIFSRSQLYVATPCQWLMDKVQQSMLASAIVESKVIPNGVDLSICVPGEKRAARDSLLLPQDAKILLFTANWIRRNIWKDFQTMRVAIARVAEQLQDEKLCLVALGENAEAEQIGRATIIYVAYQSDPAIVAQYYQAADVYVHAARAETFPTTILEAMACGTPVVATAVGGIPEQVKDSEVGYLVPIRDDQAMASRIVKLLTDDTLRIRMGRQAADLARVQFGLDKQRDAYLEWYANILQRNKSLSSRSAPTGVFS